MKISKILLDQIYTWMDAFDIKFNGSLDTDEDKIAKVFDTMLKMTAYNDLYSKYALMQECNTLSEFDSEVFEMLKIYHLLTNLMIKFLLQQNYFL